MVLLQQYLPFTVLKHYLSFLSFNWIIQLQQYLPFTVLKRDIDDHTHSSWTVATVLTVYGIETEQSCFINLAILFVATVLTVYGIETGMKRVPELAPSVATVLTVYGIET